MHTSCQQLDVPPKFFGALLKLSLKYCAVILGRWRSCSSALKLELRLERTESKEITYINPLLANHQHLDGPVHKVEATIRRIQRQPRDERLQPLRQYLGAGAIHTCRHYHGVRVVICPVHFPGEQNKKIMKSKDCF